jgi:hypothetical protein
LNRHPASSFPHPTRQRGVVLIVALLVLVVTVPAAVALVRSVDVATLVSGQSAFRLAAVQATDAGWRRVCWLATRVDNTVLKRGIRRLRSFYFPNRNGGVTAPNVF